MTLATKGNSEPTADADGGSVGFDDGIVGMVSLCGNWLVCADINLFAEFVIADW
ncbi:hypothetical protein D3C85_1853780 [compost metagenome]